MPVHIATTAVRIEIRVSMRIELREEFFECEQVKRHHPGLITIVPRTPIAFFKSTGDCQLGEFFSVTKDTKLGFAGQDLTATDDGSLP